MSFYHLNLGFEDERLKFSASTLSITVNVKADFVMKIYRLHLIAIEIQIEVQSA